MIFKTILSEIKERIYKIKKSNSKTARHQYIIDRYNERSITNRYFKKQF